MPCSAGKCKGTGVRERGDFWGRLTPTRVPRVSEAQELDPSQYTRHCRMAYRCLDNFHRRRCDHTILSLSLFGMLALAHPRLSYGARRKQKTIMHLSECNDRLV
jgi:hypothetical protein